MTYRGQIGGQVHFEATISNSFELVLIYNLKLSIKSRFISQLSHSRFE
jgi:hypothetical protein